MMLIKTKCLLAISCLILLWGQGLSAQTRSEVRVKIGTLPYYIHTIQKQETISELAVAYGVTTAHIVEANPNIEDIERIKAGQKILIPNFSDFEDKYPAGEWDIVLYKVKGEEKLKDIAKSLSAGVKDIKYVNPGVDSKLKAGSKILVPVRRGTERASERARRQEQEPEPTSKPEGGATRNPAVGFDWDAANKPAETNEARDVNCMEYNYDDRKETFTLSLVLPLHLGDEKRDNSGLYFLEGALLAIEDMKRSGLSMDVNILDVSTKDEMAKALEGHKLDNSDLIIGPFALSGLRPLAAYARERGVAMVAPYQPNALQLADSNAFVFQVYPSDEAIYGKLTSKPYAEEVNPVLIIPETPDSTMLSNYRKALQEKFGSYKELVHEMGKPSHDNALQGRLSKIRENLLFVCSNREAFVSDLMDRLQVIKMASYPVAVYGRATWLNFRIIDIARYYDLNLHIVQAFHVDYANEDVKRFIHTYRHSYNNEPTQFAFQGYDVTSYFLQAMRRYGAKFGPCLPQFPAKLLQSRYQFKRLDEQGGYVNTGAFMLEYTPDLDVIRD